MHPVKAVAVAVAVAVAAAALELTHYPRMASPRERRGAPVPGIGCPDQAGGEPGTRSLTPPPTARYLTLRRTPAFCPPTSLPCVRPQTRRHWVFTTCPRISPLVKTLVWTFE